jgi:hypothetical protein
MALIEFQRAFADLAASPRRCLLARVNPEIVLKSYNLSSIERRRLATMVRDRAMSVNCTLYRVNRLTPIYSVLPLTCFYLGDRLGSELDVFWASFDDATLQYGKEAWRFGNWLFARIAAGAIPRGPVEDAIRFELAAFEVRTAPPPRTRLLHFAYEPRAVLNPASGDDLVPAPCDRWVLLDATGASLEVHCLDGSVGSRTGLSMARDEIARPSELPAAAGAKAMPPALSLRSMW